MSPRISFSTIGCPDWSFHELLQRGPAAGFDGVEIRLLERQLDLLACPVFQPSERATRRRELADAGFRISGLGSSVNFHMPDEVERQRRLEIGMRYVDLAADLGADFVRVFGDVLQPLEAGSVPVTEVSAAQKQATLQQVIEGLNTLGDYAAPRGVRILIETHGDFADSTLMASVFEHVTSPAVGLLWDTHHPWRFYHEPLRETFERLQPWIQSTHWKDSVTRPRCEPAGREQTAREQTAREQAASKQAHTENHGHRPADYVLFGGGEFPAWDAMRLLCDAGFGGWFCLEWEKLWHPEIEAPEVALPLFPPKLRALHARASM